VLLGGEQWQYVGVFDRQHNGCSVDDDRLRGRVRLYWRSFHWNDNRWGFHRRRLDR
jgi:hypothetical protein